MKTFEDIQLAIAVLPLREWLEIRRWIVHLAARQAAVVREPAVVYGPTQALAAIQSAVQKLDAAQLAELREWLEPLANEPAEGVVMLDDDRDPPSAHAKPVMLSAASCPDTRRGRR